MRSLHPVPSSALLNQVDRKLWYQVHFPPIFIGQREPDVSIENSAHEKGSPVRRREGTLRAESAARF